MKFANAITYDNDGNVIPLSKRDNFRINDLRYAIPPILFGGSTYGLFSGRNKEK